MTTLREAAQQALEALELGYDSAKAEADQYHAAMAGYRPQRHAQMDADVQQIAAAITALKAALAEPPDSTKPVVERNFCPRCGKRTNDIHTCTPPAPLTDEIIADLWHQNGGFHHHFARAIERWLKGTP